MTTGELRSVLLHAIGDLPVTINGRRIVGWHYVTEPRRISGDEVRPWPVRLVIEVEPVSTDQPCRDEVANIPKGKRHDDQQP